MRRLLLAMAFLALAVPASALAQGKRIAFVVGNSAYRAVDRLGNPANDARLMASTLAAAGFTLVGGGPQIDLDKVHFDHAVQEFGRAVQGAEVALFYYSGHGMQVNGVNWLVPVDANPTGPRDLDFQMVDANLVLRQMEGAGTKLNLILLDACRNNPFTVRGIRASGGGLAEMQAPEGTLISYATQPGNVAADGSGQDSPYTLALVNAMRQKGADIFRVFNDVGLSVKQATGGAQLPWLASSPISGSFTFFNRDPAPPPPTAASQPTAPTPSGAADGSRAVGAAPTRFDGSWSATMICEPVGDVEALTMTFPVTITNGRLTGTYGTQGAPGSLLLEGTLGPKGAAQLVGQGLTGDPKTSMGHVSPGRGYSFLARARFERAHGTGRRTTGRTCTLEFARS